MSTTYPFIAESISDAAAPAEYQLLAKFDSAELRDYRQLFDRYQPISLVEVAALVVEEQAPSLLDFISYDEEGYWLDIQVEGEQELAVFTATVCPVYQNLVALESYVQRIARAR